MPTPWGSREKAAWLKEQTIKRSYAEEVVSKLEQLKVSLDVVQYGTLSYGYPLFLMKSRNFDPKKKTVLITGGVHGYETSGVQGAISFMQHQAQKYPQFNFLCFPCISPWGYETINRWNPLAIDPNRSFFEDSPAEECSNFLKAFAPYKSQIAMHIDLHETTDTDNSIFRPALAARDGKENDDHSEIPDGFYIVGDTRKPDPAFQKAVIDAVRPVTHIAAPDSEGKIIGVPISQEGVIYYDKKKLFLCGGVTDAPFVTTTEVYPDSPKATPAICIDAQVAAIRGGLNYLMQHPEK